MIFLNRKKEITLGETCGNIFDFAECHEDSVLVFSSYMMHTWTVFDFTFRRVSPWNVANN